MIGLWLDGWFLVGRYACDWSLVVGSTGDWSRLEALIFCGTLSIVRSGLY